MLKKLCLFQIIILTLRHKNKKLVSIMAKTERQKRIYRKRIPYGMQNFEDVIKEDCYFVDKTPFIENIEESNKYFFFIRPRRFGKSLTISMLENYYDINKKDQFESLFGKLYIGENPTPERNSYLILHLNFAMISAGLDNYKKGLDAHCNNKFNSFCSRYAHLLPPGIKEEMNQKEDAVAQLGFLCDKRFSSQRDKQKGEAYVHGFTLAMTSQCKFYRPISELDNDGGYADIFLLPLCDIYKDMEDSYIVELKYCKPGTSDELLNHLFEEASAQIRRYADSDIVRESVKTTKLHQLVVIYRGAEMAMCEEVE